MPKAIYNKNLDDSYLIPELLALLKKTIKGVVEFFEKQLSNIKISNGISLLNLLRPIGRFLSQLLLLFKFFKLFKDAIKFGNRLGKRCDFIYVPPQHSIRKKFQNTSFDHLPIKIPGNQAYLLIGNQLFFADKYKYSCIKWHIEDNIKKISFLEHTKHWLVQNSHGKFQTEHLTNAIQSIPLSEKKIRIIRELTDHKRPKEKIRGMIRPVFMMVEGSFLFFNIINNALKLSIFIASLTLFKGLISRAVSQITSILFFNISFIFIGINIFKTLSRYLNENDAKKRRNLGFKLLQQSLELSVPSIILLVGLVCLGISTSMFSTFITIAFLGLPFFQNIFRNIDTFIAFHESNPKKIKKTLKKLLKFAASILSLLTSGYVFAKGLIGVTLQLGGYLIELGHIAFNSVNLIFTAFIVFSCLVEISRNSIVLINAVKELNDHATPLVQKSLYQDVINSLVKIIFAISILCIALIGFWGIMNPFLTAGIIGSLFLVSLVVNKFASHWPELISRKLWYEHDHIQINSLEKSNIEGLKLPNLPTFSKELTKKSLSLSKHPNALYGSKIARAPLSPGESEKNIEVVPEIFVNSFDVSS